MSVLYVVTPAAFLLLVVAVVAFHWSARRGQYDDLVTPAYRALDDESEWKPGRDRAKPRGAAPPSKER